MVPLTEDYKKNSLTESGQKSGAERGEGLAAEHQGDPHGGQVTVQSDTKNIIRERKYLLSPNSEMDSFMSYAIKSRFKTH
jgi:hypothetical protein